MTSEEARQREEGVPEMPTSAWIESEIRYETVPHAACGDLCVHTYHACECGRGACRSSMCATCWRELLPYAVAAPENSSSQGGA